MLACLLACLVVLLAAVAPAAEAEDRLPELAALAVWALAGVEAESHSAEIAFLVAVAVVAQP